MSILAFAGSLRALSSNAALARFAASCSPSVVLAPKLDALPLYDGDVEDAGLPPAVAALRAQAFAASGFFFATPEYNGFTSAALKNAIDWLSRSGAEGVHPFKGKPFAVVSAGGGGGGARAQREIISIGTDFKMAHIGASSSPVCVKLFDGVARFDKATGDLVDADVKARVAALVAELAAAAAAHKAAEAKA